MKEVQIRCMKANTGGLSLLAQMSGTLPKTPFVGLGQAYGDVTQNYHGEVWLLRFQGEQTRDSIRDMMVQTLGTADLEIGEPYEAPPQGLWVNTYDGSELVERLIIIDDLRTHVHVVKNALLVWRHGAATAVEVREGKPMLYTPRRGSSTRPPHVGVRRVLPEEGLRKEAGTTG